MLNMDLSEIIQETIKAMQSVSDKIGLKQLELVYITGFFLEKTFIIENGIMWYNIYS